MNRVIHIFTLLAFTASGAAAQTAVEMPKAETPVQLGLPELLARAMQNNPSLRAYQSRTAAASQVPAQLSAWSDPVLMLELDQVPPAHNAVSMTTVAISQTIPLTNAFALAGESAERSAAAAGFEAEAFRKRLTRDVKATAYQLVLAQKKITLAEENRLLLEGFVKINLTRNSVGKGSQAEVLKSQVEVSRLTNEVFRLRQQQRALLKTLASLVGENVAGVRVSDDELMPARTSRLMTDRTVIATAAMMEDSLKAMMLENQNELRMMRERISSLRLAAESASKAGIPNLTLGLGYEYMSQTPYQDMAGPAFQYRLEINLPLFGYSAAKYRARTTELSLLQQAAEAEYESQRLMLSAALATALADLASAAETAAFYKTILIPQAESTLRSAGVAYETAKVDFLTLLDAYRTLREAKLIYFESLTSLATAQAEIDRLTTH
ncbi:MAG: TolC family protein [Rhizobacter sp.]|nr:TolC family protein [Chlorobiales bacterium]